MYIVNSYLNHKTEQEIREDLSKFSSRKLLEIRDSITNKKDRQYFYILESVDGYSLMEHTRHRERVFGYVNQEILFRGAFLRERVALKDLKSKYINPLGLVENPGIINLVKGHPVFSSRIGGTN